MYSLFDKCNTRQHRERVSRMRCNVRPNIKYGLFIIIFLILLIRFLKNETKDLFS